MEQPTAAQVLASSSPSPSELVDVYMHEPHLRGAVLAHPALSTRLRDWLLEQTNSGAIPSGDTATPPASEPVGPAQSSAPAEELVTVAATNSPVPPPPEPVPATPAAPQPVPPPPSGRPLAAADVASTPSSAPATRSGPPTGTPSAGIGSRPAGAAMTDLITEIIKDDFSKPMTPRLLPIASRTLWIFNAIAAVTLFLALVISGFKLLNISPILGLMLIVSGFVAGPLEWGVYLFLNRLALELYMNAHILAQERRAR